MSRVDLHLQLSASGTSFLDRYTHICEREGLSLFRPVLAKLSKCCLDVNLDMILKNDLMALLHAFSNDNTLRSVRFESRLLKDNPHLTSDLRKLHLHSHGRRLPAYVEPEVMSSLCKALNRHISQNELNLKVFRLIGLPVAESELAIVSAALQASKSLQLLSFEGSPLSSKHLDVLLPVLPHVQSLTVLNFAQCRLGRAEILQISQYLQVDRKLQRLTLNGNPIGDSGIEQLVKALRHHTSLKALDLQNCGLSSTGCRSLENLLRNNLEIEICDIRRNTAVSRNSALAIAEILFENTKYRPSGNTFRPLDLDMSPSIDGNRLALEDSGLDEVRHNPTIRETPSVKLPPKDLQLKIQGSDDYKTKLIISDVPAHEGIYISNDLLSKFETSLVKFQVLLDYLESEHLETGLGPLGGGGSHSVSRTSSQQHNPHVQKRLTTRVVVQKSIPSSDDLPGMPQAGVLLTSEKKNSQPDDQEPALKENKNSRCSKSYTNCFTDCKSSSTLSTKANLIPVSDKTPSGKVNRQKQDEESAFVSDPTTTGAIITKKNNSTVKKSSSKAVDPKAEQQDKDKQDEENENDRTITSDHEFDNGSFEFNFTDIGGITKESSYMKIAGEIFDDPKDVLESTRTSLTPSRVSSITDSHASTKTATNTNTNVDELQERLRNIQSRYNVASCSLKTLNSVTNEAGENVQRKTHADNVISSLENWSAGDGKRSLELSDVSLESSFSGDLTGSDLDKF
ncbi:uncharacterized protein LOC111270960 [Varroa jacobsoni]|uniref:Uncharacterized protein n=1 Tax=Varroa destructor TaxID=109461 RepID=A0A7M7JG64_VARDE|nr:uncharacterized protein LOC111246391 [Varroa destructor]XP_022707190.1 uncharacterized protein LOC111270960 [Varroa jacobsoni]